MTSPAPLSFSVSEIPMYEHQLKALQFLERREGKAALFMDMGTGKTRSALTYARVHNRRRVLVVAPLSAVSVWKRECAKIGYALPVVDLTRAAGVKAQAATMEKLCRADLHAIVLVNYEAYWREPLQSWILKWAPETVIVDEAQKLRSRTTKQSRFAHKLADQAFVKDRIALTGTPIGNGVQDLWSIYRFLDWTLFYKRWAEFEREYLQMGGYLNKEIIGCRNLPKVKRLVQSSAFRVTKAEALDLPDRQDVQINVVLDPKTQAAYDEMKKFAVLELQAIDGTDRQAIARTALVLILRLQQITSGFTREVGDSQIVPIGNEKARIATELIESANGSAMPVVVFARFLRDLDTLAETLPTDLRVAQFHGDVSSRDRERILDEFAAGQIDVLLVQIRTGSLGIDLTRACTAIFYSTGYSLDDFLQSRDRLHRIGQTRPVTYYYLVADGTVDEKIIAALQNKVSVAEQVTSLSYAVNLIKG